MGSAFSSNAKGLSLRRIGSAAAIVCVALLLVIAGGVATLHLRENTPPVRGGVLVQDRGTTMRRVPRKMLLAEAVEQTTKAPSRKIHRASKRRPSFPRGVAHDTTNLEMEPSLAGDPEHRKKQRRPRRRRQQSPRPRASWRSTWGSRTRPPSTSWSPSSPPATSP